VTPLEQLLIASVHIRTTSN